MHQTFKLIRFLVCSSSLAPSRAGDVSGVRPPLQHRGAVLGSVSGVPRALPQQQQGVGGAGLVPPDGDVGQVHGDRSSGGKHLRLRPVQL